jgi:hypothetical protein
MLALDSDPCPSVSNDGSGTATVSHVVQKAASGWNLGMPFDVEAEGTFQYSCSSEVVPDDWTVVDTAGVDTSNQREVNTAIFCTDVIGRRFRFLAASGHAEGMYPAPPYTFPPAIWRSDQPAAPAWVTDSHLWPE